MKNKIIVLLSIFSFSLFQASDIFKAIESKNQKAIQSWLKYSADVDLINDQGETVLMKAVQVNNKSLVHKLLKAGALVNTVDRFGRTALDYAVELSSKDIVRMLVKNNGMVTSEMAAVKYEQLIKKISIWRVISACVFGVGCLSLVLPFALGAVMASVMLLGVGGSSLPLLISSLAILGVSSAVVYGSVKIGTKKENDYLVEVLEPAL